MKLYATITSERAEKGQGGNEHMRAVFTGEMRDGVRRELLHVFIEPCPKGYALHVCDHWGNDLVPEPFIIEDDTTEKGEKQKGEMTLDEAMKATHKPCSKHGTWVEGCGHCHLV